MKKKRFDKSILKRGYHVHIDNYTMNLTAKYGTISVSKQVGQMLGLKKNKIAFIQDEEHPSCWYLEIDNSKDGLQMREMNNNRFVYQSVQLVHEIYKSSKLDLDKRYSVNVGKEQIDGMWAIITHGATPKEPINRKKSIKELA